MEALVIVGILDIHGRRHQVNPARVSIINGTEPGIAEVRADGGDWFKTSVMVQDPAPEGEDAAALPPARPATDPGAHLARQMMQIADARQLELHAKSVMQQLDLSIAKQRQLARSVVPAGGPLGVS